MAKISEEIRRKTTSLATRFGKTKEEIVAEYKEIYNHPVVAKQENRAETAYMALFAKYVNELGRPTESYKVFVVHKGAPETYPRRDKTGTVSLLNVVGFVRNGDGSLNFARITHYDDTFASVEDIDAEMMWYDANLFGRKENETYVLQGSASTKYRKCDEQDKVDLSNEVLSVLMKSFKRFNIKDADYNIGDDAKLVIGMVNRSGIITTKHDSKMGMYRVIDESMDMDDAEKMGGGFSVMCAPEMVKYDWPTRVAILGVVRPPVGEYPTCMNARLVIPLGEAKELPRSEEEFSSVPDKGSDLDEDMIVIEDDDFD